MTQGTLTERDLEVLETLVCVCDAHLPNNPRNYQSPCLQTSRGEGCASPLDCGGSDGSDHSYRLTKLVRAGLAEHRKRGFDWGKAPTSIRSSKVYRPTETGRFLVRERMANRRKYK